MSREVAGRAGIAAQPGGRAMALALLVAAGMLLAPSVSSQPTQQIPPPTSQWLRADILPAADQSTGLDGDDLGRVAVTLALTNGLPTPIQLTDVAVLGFGTVLIDRGPSGITTIGPAATVRLPASVLADCTRRLDPTPVVVVVRTVGDSGKAAVAQARPGPAERLRSVLDPVCPQTPSSFAVAITGSRPQADGSLLVRLLNTGRVFSSVVALAGPGAGGARLVPEPPLPASLGPGEAVLTTLRFAVPHCSVPDPVGQSRQLSLEARTPWGYTAVTGWPADAAARALRATVRACTITHGKGHG